MTTYCTTYLDSVFEVVVRPSTWDGPEQDRSIGLYSTVQRAQDGGREWIAANPYWFQGGGRWQLVISERPIDATAPVGYVYGVEHEQEVLNLLERDDQGATVPR